MAGEDQIVLTPARIAQRLYFSAKNRHNLAAKQVHVGR